MKLYLRGSITDEVTDEVMSDLSDLFYFDTCRVLSSVLSDTFSSVGQVLPGKTKHNMERQQVTDNVCLTYIV